MSLARQSPTASVLRGNRVGSPVWAASPPTTARLYIDDISLRSHAQAAIGTTSTAAICEVDGLCAPDPTCGGGCPVGSGEVCDPTRGLCICDPSCNASCQPGQTCDNNENINGCTGKTQAQCTGACGWDADLRTCVSSTCGQCVCDRTCNGGCLAGESLQQQHHLAHMWPVRLRFDLRRLRSRTKCATTIPTRRRAVSASPTPAANVR